MQHTQTARQSAQRSAGPLLFFLLSLVLTMSGSATATAESAAGTSDAGVVPELWSGNRPGGNVTCAELAPGADLITSPRLEWSGGGIKGTVPAGLDIVVSGETTVSWSSAWPMTAVIVKGGNAANVYRYQPAVSSDGGLVTPHNSSGGHAEVSNLTFCWLDEPEEHDLALLCAAAAEAAVTDPIVSFSGVMLIADGEVATSSVPSGHVLHFDPVTERIDFEAPYPVVAAVTRASDPIVHLMEQPAPTGTLAFTANPGSGEVLLCGLETRIVVLASCDAMPGTILLGPIPIRSSTIDPEHVQQPLLALSIGDETLDFVSATPVAAVVVVASDPVVHTFDTAIMSGSVPLILDSTTGDADVMFCLRTSVTSSSSGSSSEAPATLAQAPRPTEIASGGGPRSRVSASLMVLTLLALAATRWRALWWLH